MARHTVFDRSKLPSRHATVGPDRAPNRSYYFAMGLRREDIEAPFVGVVTTWNEAAPCNIALARQAQAAKRGVAKAGGTPREFTTITVTDGIAMGHQGMKSSLVSREVIADSTVDITGRALSGLRGSRGVSPDRRPHATASAQQPRAKQALDFDTHPADPGE